MAVANCFCFMLYEIPDNYIFTYIDFTHSVLVNKNGEFLFHTLNIQNVSSVLNKINGNTVHTYKKKSEICVLDIDLHNTYRRLGRLKGYMSILSKS